MFCRHPAAPRDGSWFAAARHKGGGGGTVVQQPSTSTTVSKSEPWDGQKSYLTDVFGKAQAQYNSYTPQYFPGKTYVDFSPQTEQALTMQESRAKTGSPLVSAAQGQNLMTQMGGYLGRNPIEGMVGGIARGDTALSNPAFQALGGTAMGQNLRSNVAYNGLGGMAQGGANPYLDAMFGSAANRVTEQYRNAIAPSTMSRFEAAGRFGSDAMREQQGTDQTALARGLGDMAAQMYGGAYDTDQNRRLSALGQMGQIDLNERAQQLQAGTALGGFYDAGQGQRLQAAGMVAAPWEAERNRMVAAGQLAPTLANQDYYDASKLAEVGAARESLSQLGLEDQINRFNFQQQLPYSQLGQYANLVQGNYAGGTSTSNTQMGSSSRSNPLMTGISGGLGGAASGALMGSMIPGLGTGIGALIGGGLGLLGGFF